MLFTPISEEEAEEDAKFIALRNQHFELRRNVCTSTTWCSLDTVAESFINIDGPVEYSSLNDYLYFSVQKPGWQDMTKLIISEFLQNKDNIDFAGRCVGRKPAGYTFEEVILGYSPIKFRSENTTKWRHLVGKIMLGIPDKDNNKHPQTLVFIALEDIGPDNGFFMAVNKGDYICIDQQRSVAYPPTGGGHCIYLILNV